MDLNQGPRDYESLFMVSESIREYPLYLSICLIILYLLSEGIRERLTLSGGLCMQMCMQILSCIRKHRNVHKWHLQKT